MNNKNDVREVRVSSSTEVSKLAGSLIAGFEESPDKQIRVIAMGAGAINQALKGIIAFNEFLARSGHISYMMPSFHNFSVGSRPMTAVQMELDIRRL